MFSLPSLAVTRKILQLRNRFGNLPEDEMREAMEEGMETQWDALMSKAESYVQGEEVLEKGGHFSAASCGNWFLIADAAGVERVPGRVVSVISSTLVMSAYMNLMNAKDEAQRAAFFEAHGDEFGRFFNDLQVVEEDEVLRFDTGADGRLKHELAFGRENGLIPEFKGYQRRDGVVVPDFDERIVDHAMANPENQSPVWARKWVELAMLEGDREQGFIYTLNKSDMERAMDPMSDEQNSGDIGVDEEQVSYAGAPETGNKFPREWRVFVKNGEIRAIGNYYTQIARARTAEDEQDAAQAVVDVHEAASRMLAIIKEKVAIPHHPQYEDPTRKDFDPDAIHFTIDFAEVVDPEHPLGRRVVLMDAGVGHLRNPPFGANPVSFGSRQEPEGVAFAFGDVRTFEEVFRIAGKDMSTDTPAP